jgi:two-component system chemotaxis sensor kinase CheA
VQQRKSTPSPVLAPVLCAVSLGVLFAACSSSGLRRPSSTTPDGSSSSNGGTGGTSGPGTGGTGGTSETGGVTGAGSVTNTGGVTGSGGLTVTGGVTNTGGVTSSGGVTDTGGANTSGGITKSGGATNSGGMRSRLHQAPRMVRATTCIPGQPRAPTTPRTTGMLPKAWPWGDQSG